MTHREADSHPSRFRIDQREAVRMHRVRRTDGRVEDVVHGVVHDTLHVGVQCDDRVRTRAATSLSAGAVVVKSAARRAHRCAGAGAVPVDDIARRGVDGGVER